MKNKLFYGVILASIILFSCEQISLNKFNPPSWIIGTWADINNSEYVFTSDDIVLKANYTSSSYKDSFATLSVTEEITDAQYKVTVSGSGVNQVSRFDRLTSTTLNYYLTSYGTTYGPMVLTKK